MTLKYKHILVAIDGSDEAQLAFKKSIGIAQRNDAELNILYVVDPRSYTAVRFQHPEVQQDAFRFGEELVETYKQYAVTAGIEKVNGIVVSGSPKRVIAPYTAKQARADLIICGASGLNAFDRFMLGSVSQHIVRNSPCDVLVVRTGEKEEINNAI